MVNLHLWDCIGPWHPQNADMLNDVALLVKTLQRPFIVAGDWNAEPEDVRACGFLDAAEASLLCTGRATCHLRVTGGKIKDSEFEYWAVSSNSVRERTAILRSTAQ